MRESMIIYRSFYEAIKNLPAEDAAQVYNAIFDYGLNGNAQELSGIALTIFTLIKPQLDANIRKFENGTKGGRPKQDQTKKEPKQNLSEIKTKGNVNDNVNVNVNKNVFVPPTKEEINSEFPGFDAERFIDFYSSKGWMVGKNKMKDWKASVRTWLRSSDQKSELAAPKYKKATL